jgi:hypothetical protein
MLCRRAIVTGILLSLVSDPAWLYLSSGPCRELFCQVHFFCVTVVGTGVLVVVIAIMGTSAEIFIDPNGAAVFPRFMTAPFL